MKWIRRLLGWIRRLLGLQLVIFTILGAINGLSGGQVSVFLSRLCLPVLVVVLLYWTIPVALASLAMVAVWGCSVGRDLYSRWKTRRYFGRVVVAEEVVAAISQAEHEGLLRKPEVRVLARAARDLQSVEFDLIVLLDDPSGWAKRSGIQATSYSQVLRLAIPSLARREEQVDQYIRRLHTKGLVDKQKLPVVEAVSNALPSMTTQMGRQLAYLVRRLREG